MNRFILALLLTFVTSTVVSALSPREAGKLLASSVVRLESGSATFCTAFKIGVKKFLTARHCSQGVDSNTKIVHGSFSQFIRSALVTLQEKPSGSRKEDWMILNATYVNPDTETLTLGCDDDLYLGMPVAYGGYPRPLNFTVGFGRVISLEKADNYKNNLDFVIDVHGAPGASGSPVINLDTGNVIGILIEGVSETRAGAYAIGIESITNLDICEDASINPNKS